MYKQLNKVMLSFIQIHKTVTLVKNKYIKMYLKCIFVHLFHAKYTKMYIFKCFLKIPCSCIFGMLNWYT